MGFQYEGRFMVAVGTVIEHEGSGKLLLLKRTLKAGFAPGIWEIVTGRMKQFEELEEALRGKPQKKQGSATYAL
ncbi:MAG: hypothetical protein U1A16_04570 [Patescibacteria group bacterium]|nr:hypothetical protein [Patescibacteria group bacterium]